MTEWIEDRPTKKKTFEKLEEFEVEIMGIIKEAFQEGKKAGAAEEIKVAYEKGFKEGQKTALRSVEGANKKIYGG